MNTVQKAQAWLDSTTEEGGEDAAIHNAHDIITALLAEREALLGASKEYLKHIVWYGKDGSSGYEYDLQKAIQLCEESK